MTFSAVSTIGSSTANSFTITPSGTGDFILLGVLSGFVAGSTTSYATALSATNISWSVLVAHTAFSANTGVETIFIGQVTSASSATTTITFNTGTPTCRTAWQEFSNTGGYSVLALDGNAYTVDLSSNGQFPLATPTRTGDLYWSYMWDNGTGVNGNTSGFTYQLDANTNVTAYNTNCTSGSQRPNIGDSNGTSGIAVLLYEAVTTNAIFPAVQQGSRLYRQWSYRSQVLALGPQVMNVVAGLATGTGNAPAPRIGNQAGSVTGTGTAATVSAELTPALATGAGSPLDGSEGTAVALTTGLATGTGTAPSPQPSSGADPTAATATGAALPVPLSIAAGAVQPQPGSQLWQRFFHRRQISPLAPNPPVSQPLIMSGFGTFPQVPVNSIILTVIANVSTFGSDVLTQGSLYELWDGTNALIGSQQQGTPSTSSSWVDSVVFTGVTYSQLATLQLRIYARSMNGNHGAAVSVDAVSLSVEWLPHQDVNIVPAVVAAKTAFPKAALSTGETVTPGVLAVVPVFPAASAGLLNASIFPGVLKTKAVFPKATLSTGVNLSPAVLAVVPGLPAVPDVTYPGWASAETDGGWTAPGNVTGTPDGSYATWTVP